MELVCLTGADSAACGIWEHEMKRSACQQGWSLVEAMTVVAILGVLSAAAGPSLTGTLEATFRQSFANEALMALSLARSEAIKRSDQVVFCKAGSAAGCSAAGDWRQGWLAFHDSNGNAQWDETESVVLRREALPPGWRLSGNGPVANYVAYQSLGNARLVTGGFQAGTFTLCKESARPTTAIRLVINSVGRPRTETVRVASC